MADDLDDVEFAEFEEAFRRSQASMREVFTRGFDRLEASLHTIIQRIDNMVRVKDGLSTFPRLTSSVEKEIDPGTQECTLFTVEENKIEELSGSNLSASYPDPEFEVDATEAVELLTLNVQDSSLTTNAMLPPPINVPAIVLDGIYLIPSEIKPEGLAPPPPSLLCSIKDYTYIGPPLRVFHSFTHGFTSTKQKNEVMTSCHICVNFTQYNNAQFGSLTNATTETQCSNLLQIGLINQSYEGLSTLITNVNGFPTAVLLDNFHWRLLLEVKRKVITLWLPFLFCFGIYFSTTRTMGISSVLHEDLFNFINEDVPLLLMCENISYEFSNFLPHRDTLSLHCCSDDTLNLLLWVVTGMLLRLVFDPGTFNSIKFYYLNCSVVMDMVWIYHDFITDIPLSKHGTFGFILEEPHYHYCPIHFSALEVHISCLINCSLVFCENYPLKFATSILIFLCLSSIRGFDMGKAKENWSLTLNATPWSTLFLQTPNFAQVLEQTRQKNLERRLLDLFDNSSIRIWIYNNPLTTDLLWDSYEMVEKELNTDPKGIQQVSYAGSWILFWGKRWNFENQGINLSFIYDPGSVLYIFFPKYIFQFCLFQEVVSLELVYIGLAKSFTSCGMDNCFSIWDDCSKKMVQLGIIILGPTIVTITFEIVCASYEWHCVAHQTFENYTGAVLESVINAGFLYVASSPLIARSIYTIWFTGMPYIESRKNFLSFVVLLLVQSCWFPVVFLDNKFYDIGVLIWFSLWILNTHGFLNCGACLIGNLSQIMYTTRCQVQTLVLSCYHFMSRRKGQLHFVVLILVELSDLSLVIHVVVSSTTINVNFQSWYGALPSGGFDCNLLLLYTKDNQFHDLEGKVTFNGGSNVMSIKEMGLDGLSKRSPQLSIHVWQSKGAED